MQNKTDIKYLKDMAKNFLYMDLSGQDSAFWPVIVQHPVFTSAMVGIGDKFYNVTNPEELDIVRKEYCKKVDDMKNPLQIVDFIHRPYRMTFLKYTKNALSAEDFSRLLKWVWITTENPNQDVNVSVKTAARWFRQADKKYLMDEKEYEVYQNIPEEITLYRGVAVDRNPDGLSWTDDIEVARWFSHRFDLGGKKGCIQYAKVKKQEVLAYFENEKEYVVQVKNPSILEEN